MNNLKPRAQQNGHRITATAACALAVSMLVLWTVQPATGAGKRIRFIDSTDLDGLGVKLKLMPHSKSLPLPSPKSFHYTFTRGEKSWKEELFDPIELWSQSQHAGRWTDDDDNTLTLATISQHRPSGFARKHVSPEEYKRVIALPENRPQTTWTPSDLSRWASGFVGTPTATAIPVRSPSLSLQKVFRIKLPDQPPTRIAYVVQPVVPGTAKALQHANPWIYVQLDLGEQVNVTKAPAAIESSLLASIRRVTFMRTSANASRRTSMQSARHTGDNTDAFKRSREATIRSIANMQNWWYVETRNYIVLSDLSSRHRSMIKALQKNVEQIREVYRKYIPPIVEISAVGVIRMPSSSDLYESYTGSEKKWTGGMWMPAIRELLIRAPESGSTRTQRERFLQVAYHEAFHQYLFYALGKRPTPAWFNEGHAALFENAAIRSGRVRISESDRNVARLLGMFDRGKPHIRELLTMTYPQFYDADPNKRADNYALAWALVYYIRKGANQERPARYHRICETLIGAIAKGEQGATKRAFKAVDMTHFEAQFTDFWTSKKRRHAAELSSP